ncbi:hypothetical protein BBK36DRAFT_1139660 [Trichoderma citrinoviride]|uniref:DUF7587 domain-containing protein n=1 Tax=Trichoderma citrinoviride TaxID=58853 RepID=A0A2T4BFR0_9HYPO|nr:hypothetical protein BBK36DRAFT_1139660 [Trichoderma citrinoviride]PTB68157.1 hypothetical protein BBK36DRAFT_1139660 [Trichoderma citrinoviride]
MASTFDLKPYVCDSLPEKFYRIDYTGSQTSKDATGDYVARANFDMIPIEKSFKEILEDHFKWEHVPSCFISVLSDKEHADYWAGKAPAWLRSRGVENPEVSISEIDTTQLPAGTYVFMAKSLVNRLDIKYKYWKHEYLFLHRIPHEAIISPQGLKSPKEAEMTKEAEKTKETGKSGAIEDPGTCDSAVNNGTSSPDGETDLSEKFDGLQIKDSVPVRSTPRKMRSEKKPIVYERPPWCVETVVRIRRRKNEYSFTVEA